MEPNVYMTAICADLSQFGFDPEWSVLRIPDTTGRGVGGSRPDSYLDVLEGRRNLVAHSGNKEFEARPHSKAVPCARDHRVTAAIDRGAHVQGAWRAQRDRTTVVQHGTGTQREVAGA